MIKIKYIFRSLTGLLLAAALATPLQAADTLEVTLGEVLDYARGNSPQIMAAGSQAEAAGGMELASMAGFLPHLKLSEQLMRGNDPVFAFGSRLRQGRFTQNDFALDALNHPAALTNYATSVLVQQPIYNGGMSIYGHKTAVSYADAARSGKSAVTDQTLFMVKQAYYGVILARKNQEVIDAAVKSAASHAHQAGQFAATGMATRADELKAQVRLAELEQQQIRVENMIEVMVENLKLASGWHNEQFLLPSDELTGRPLELDLGELTKYAKANQPALAAARHVAKAAEYDARAAWGEVIPHLNSFFQYERDGLDAFGGDGDNWMVGVSLDWYPFDGLGNVGKIRSKRAMREKAGWDAALADHHLEVQVKEAYLNIGATNRMLGVARQAVEQARESLRIVENQYAEGLATITDLLDTEVAATNSELSMTQALFDYNLALARLSLVTGGFPELN